MGQIHCTPDGPYCDHMGRAIGDTGDRQRGIGLVSLANFKTGEHTRDLIVYRKSRGDKGICLNVCPWCAGPVIEER